MKRIVMYKENCILDIFIFVLRNTMTCLIYVNSFKMIVSQLRASINDKIFI